MYSFELCYPFLYHFALDYSQKLNTIIQENININKVNMNYSNHTKNIYGKGSVFFQSWIPSQKPSALLILIHGFGEHSSRYATHFAEFYNNENIGILTFDLPGHGKSSGKKGHIAEPAVLLEIIDKMIKEAKEKYPLTPIFLYGHSFGGEVTLWYTLVRTPPVNGIIVTAPLIGPKEAVPQLKLILAEVMDKVLPSFSLDNGIDVNLLSRDPEIVKQYISDPLVHNKISAKSGMFVINRGQWILDNAQENRNQILVMVGKGEGVVNKEAIDKFCRSAPSITYKVWPNLFHELHNEPEKKEIFEYTLKWIKSY